MKKKTTQFSRVARMINAPKCIRWYKKYISRRNRRKANQNPESIDKKLDAWELIE